MRKLTSANSVAANSILLTFAQIVTTLVGMLATKLLSVHFSLQEYGSYSQAMLVANTVTSLSILGLTNATNYFYNRTKQEAEQRAYIATIFSIQYVIGLVCGLMIILLKSQIAGYFNNGTVEKYLLIIAFTPLLNNLIAMYQTLFVSIGRAKVIAVRNFLVSMIRLLAVLISCYLLRDIVGVVIVVLAMDLFQVVYFFLLFKKYRAPVKIRDTDLALVKKILTFSIPMAIYVLTNSLSRDIDKYVVSALSDTEALAIYTNSAKMLPFDMLTSSLITVLIPIITRMINQKQYDEAKNIFKLYLRIGSTLTFIFVGGAIALAKNLMVFLYDEKFLSGLPVFVTYLVIDVIRFANVTTILSGAGKTRILMRISVATMLCNAVFNVVGFRLWGMVGPAIVTLILTVFMIAMLLHFGAKEIRARVIDLFNLKEIAMVGLEVAAVGSAVWQFSRYLGGIGMGYAVNLILCYGIYIITLGLLNYKRALACYRSLNQYK